MGVNSVFVLLTLLCVSLSIISMEINLLRTSSPLLLDASNRYAFSILKEVDTQLYKQSPSDAILSICRFFT